MKHEPDVLCVLWFRAVGAWYRAETDELLSLDHTKVVVGLPSIAVIDAVIDDLDPQIQQSVRASRGVRAFTEGMIVDQYIYGAWRFVRHADTANETVDAGSWSIGMKRVDRLVQPFHAETK